MFGLEIFGVITAVVYVMLAAKQSVFAWLFAAISSLTYLLIFWQAGLYFESLLQVFFVATAAYGYYCWRVRRIKLASIRTDSLLSSSRVPLCLAAGSLILGSGAYYFTQSLGSYPDAAIFAFSIYATYLTARKFLSSWVYWIAIDATASLLYLYKGLYLTATLYFAFIFLAAYGLKQWREDVSR